MSYTVSIYSKNKDEGSIEYMASKEVLDSAEGFFSFTYYIPYKPRDYYLERDYHLPKIIYMKGIISYLKLIDEVNAGAVGAGEAAQGGVFKNWKVLIYTDEYTYTRMQNFKNETVDEAVWLRGAGPSNDARKMLVYQVRLEKIESEKEKLKELQEGSEQLLQKAMFAVVKWPSHEYTNDKHDIHGPSLRTFRSRAPFDFPTKPIFIRDADTLFPKSLEATFNPDKTHWYFQNEETKEFSQKKLNAYKEKFISNLYKWEENIYKQLPIIEKIVPNPILVGAGYNVGGDNPFPRFYKADWHSNELLRREAPFGIFAGFITISPGAEVYKTMDVWDDYIEYMNARSKRDERKRSEFELFHAHLFKNPKKKFLTEDEKKIVYNFLLKKEPTQEKKNALKKELNSEAETIEEKYKFSNDNYPEEVGRDEQFYLFLLIPKAIQNVFFYKIHYGDLENKLTEIDEEFHKKYKENFLKSMAISFKSYKISKISNNKYFVGGRKTRRQKKKPGTRKRITKQSPKH